METLGPFSFGVRVGVGVSVDVVGMVAVGDGVEESVGVLVVVVVGESVGEGVGLGRAVALGVNVIVGVKVCVACSDGGVTDAITGPLAFIALPIPMATTIITIIANPIKPSALQAGVRFNLRLSARGF